MTAKKEKKNDGKDNKDGQATHLEIVNSPLEDENGNPVPVGDGYSNTLETDDEGRAIHY